MSGTTDTTETIVTPTAVGQTGQTARTGQAVPDDPGARIAAARERIDDLDARILGLIRERMDVSAEVQRTRLAAGGRRVHLARENEILRRYRDGLGRPGTRVAMTLLDLCRGSL
ncbi:chorismate mutase [Streptomyces sp. RFCAC02]|uniref:chorismate mutase n=1 Tax=Streptomyces sp. RFCAC02 TaxID=2499143 RepID=UPI00101FFCAE|nr:chorismate mutase [Streptomyces sp. RFCAC02]